MRNSSDLCIQVRWPHSFLEPAPPSYHGAGSGLVLRGSLDYTQMFLKGPKKKKFPKVISFQGKPSLPAVLPFSCCRRSCRWIWRKTLVPLKAEFGISWPHSVTCHAPVYVSQHRFLLPYQICYFNSKNTIGAYIGIYCGFFNHFIPTVCDSVLDTCIMFSALS